MIELVPSQSAVAQNWSRFELRQIEKFVLDRRIGYWTRFIPAKKTIAIARNQVVLPITDMSWKQFDQPSPYAPDPAQFLQNCRTGVISSEQPLVRLPVVQR